jgi:hypothetical protein
VFTVSFPNATLAALTFSAGVASSTCILKFSVIPPALAVRTTAGDPAPVETVALKLALVAPSATVTEAGTVTAALLLARLTVVPPLGAAAVSDTEHGTVPGPVTA